MTSWLNWALVSLLVLAPRALGDPRIVTFYLNPGWPMNLPVSSQSVTLCRFPTRIDRLQAIHISTNSGVPAPFMLTITPGASQFSVYATRAGARATLHVSCQGKLFVLDMQESDSPILSARFLNPNSDTPSGGPVDPVQLLRRARFADQIPSQGLSPMGRIPMQGIFRQKEIHFTVVELFHFKNEGIAVFHLKLHNTRRTPTSYERSSFRLWQGTNQIPQVVSDASGIVPPRETEDIYFAVPCHNLESLLASELVVAFSQSKGHP